MREAIARGLDDSAGIDMTVALKISLAPARAWRSLDEQKPFP